MVSSHAAGFTPAIIGGYQRGFGTQSRKNPPFWHSSGNRRRNRSQWRIYLAPTGGLQVEVASRLTFLFNSDASRGSIFAEAFAAELPDIPFCMEAGSVDPDAVRYLIT